MYLTLPLSFGKVKAHETTANDGAGSWAARRTGEVGPEGAGLPRERQTAQKAKETARKESLTEALSFDTILGMDRMARLHGETASAYKTRLTLTEIMASRPWLCSDHHFVTCRFCGESGFIMAWKYGVRHYACTNCAKTIIEGPFGVFK